MSEGIWKGREGTYTGIRSVSGDGIAVQVIWNDCLREFTNQSITQYLGAGEGEKGKTDLKPTPRKIISEQLGIDELWAKYIC